MWVARNLHLDLWSLRVRGRVVGYTDGLTLRDVTFRVSEVGRQRVLRERKKNVHAYVVGTLIESGGCRLPEPGWIRVTYNPYKGNYFYEAESGKEVKEAKEARFGERCVWILPVDQKSSSKETSPFMPT